MPSIDKNLYLGSLEAATDKEWVPDNAIHAIFGFLDPSDGFKYPEVIRSNCECHLFGLMDGSDDLVEVYLRTVHNSLTQYLRDGKKSINPLPSWH